MTYTTRVWQTPDAFSCTLCATFHAAPTGVFNTALHRAPALELYNMFIAALPEAPPTAPPVAQITACPDASATGEHSFPVVCLLSNHGFILTHSLPSGSFYCQHSVPVLLSFCSRPVFILTGAVFILPGAVLTLPCFPAYIQMSTCPSTGRCSYCNVRSYDTCQNSLTSPRQPRRNKWLPPPARTVRRSRLV